MPITETCRQSVLAFEKRFIVLGGAVDLLALFDALRPNPEQTRLYVHVSRVMRAEGRAKK
jgi:hypothetical protein